MVLFFCARVYSIQAIPMTSQFFCKPISTRGVLLIKKIQIYFQICTLKNDFSPDSRGSIDASLVLKYTSNLIPLIALYDTHKKKVILGTRYFYGVDRRPSMIALSMGVFDGQKYFQKVFQHTTSSI